MIAIGAIQLINFIFQPTCGDNAGLVKGCQTPLNFRTRS